MRSEPNGTLLMRASLTLVVITVRFLMQAVEELNIKPQNWKELVTDEPFTRKDIITIQDPKNLQKFNLSAFYHIKNNIKVADEGEEVVRFAPGCSCSSDQYSLKQNALMWMIGR